MIFDYACAGLVTSGMHLSHAALGADVPLE
jgi:hypothetical protein